MRPCSNRGPLAGTFNPRPKRVALRRKSPRYCSSVTLENPAGGKALPPAIALLDKALSLQAPLVDRHIARLRRNRPDATPAEITRRLNAEFRAATISSGAGVGAAAAAPGFGTAAALALSGTEAIGFANATALYVLSRSAVHGIPVHDVERRRTLVMAVMLGGAGAKSCNRLPNGLVSIGQITWCGGSHKRGSTQSTGCSGSIS